MKIGKKDILWNYIATFFKIASGVLLLPLILKMLSAEEVGIWTIFLSVTALINLLDFGFTPSFSRSITYIYSGVNSLKTEGFELIENKNNDINYSLLKGTILSMRWFYLRMSIILFFILSTFGTYYISLVLKKYSGEHSEIYIAWIILILISTYYLYTLYYDSLLLGKGLIKQSKQITIAGQFSYLITASILLLLGYGLIAIVSSQVLSVIIIRIFSHRTFFTKKLQKILLVTKAVSVKKILRSLFPNSLKMGLTSLGGFLVSRSSIFIGSLYLTLDEIASYGITIQLIGVLYSLSGIYISTYFPLITQLRVEQNNIAIKKIYLKGQIILFFTFILGGICLYFLGDMALVLIGSKTQLVPQTILAVAVIIAFLENNHGVAGGILLTKNEVPFYKAAIFSGILTVLFLFLFFHYTDIGIWSMFLASGIAQALYQNWKWPLTVKKELQITLKDLKLTIYSFRNYLVKMNN